MVIEEKNKSLFQESLSSELEKMGTNSGKESSFEQEKSGEKISTSAKTVMAQLEISTEPLSTRDLLDDSKESLEHTDIYGGQDIKIENYNKSFVLTLLIGAITLSATIVSFSIFAYLQIESSPNTEIPSPTYVQWISQAYNKYGQLLGLFDLEKYKSEEIDFRKDGQKKLENLIGDTRLNYVQKEHLLQRAVSSLTDTIIELKEETAKIQEQLNKDGFFPGELIGILKKDNAVGSIQRSLLSLEVVKFTSAMKVFSLMDVFLSDLSSLLGPRKHQLKERFDALIARGERDVKNYLSYCYNNPYEPETCSIIGDFDKYYRMSSRDKNFDTSFFKRLMALINDKLELSHIPSFSITFNSFDGKSNNITFTIEVNTLKEDEYELRKQGIKTPHIFIVSELIKLLKQSTFIVGKAIDAKDIKVNSKKIEIGGSEYTVNNSIKTFNLPIQKETEREIFDYVDSYQGSIEFETKGNIETKTGNDLNPIIQRGNLETFSEVVQE